MSNSQSNRRRLAPESADSTSPQHNADDLRYDGDGVPVLIRLPDLSPEAHSRAPSATAATHVAPAKAAQTNPPVQQQAPGAAKPAPTSTEASTPDALPTPSASRSAAASSQPTSGPSRVAEDWDVDSQGDATTGDQADETPSASSTTQSTPATAEGSPKKRRRRKRSGRQQDGQPADQVTFTSPPGSRRGASPKGTSTKDVVRQDRNILAFDRSRLLIGVGLVVVAGLTYFALRGGGDDSADTAGTWVGSEIGSLLPTSDPQAEAEVDLWPANEGAQVSHEESKPLDPAPSETAAGSHWPAEPGQPSEASQYDSATMPEVDYSYSAPPIMAPTNGQNSTPPDYAVPSNEGTTSGWPTDSTIPVQPVSAEQPVQAWPDAAMADPAQNAPSGAPNGYYQSQAAGYTSPPVTAEGYGETPAVRTGRLETTSPYPGNSTLTADNPGSQLNGTIEIPRPRANNEYNGSNVY